MLWYFSTLRCTEYTSDQWSFKSNSCKDSQASGVLPNDLCTEYSITYRIRSTEYTIPTWY
jgi:hypothetical protein